MGGENKTWEEYRNTENTGEQELESDDRIQEGFSYKIKQDINKIEKSPNHDIHGGRKIKENNQLNDNNDVDK